MKEKDLFAWRYGKDIAIPDRVMKAWQSIQELPEVRLRSVDPKNMEREIRAIMDIYNDAWAGKWAMVPALPDEVEKVAKDFKLDPRPRHRLHGRDRRQARRACASCCRT